MSPKQKVEPMHPTAFWYGEEYKNISFKVCFLHTNESATSWSSKAHLKYAKQRRSVQLTLNFPQPFKTRCTDWAQVEWSSTSFHPHTEDFSWSFGRTIIPLFFLLLRWPHSSKLIITKVWRKMCGRDREGREEGEVKEKERRDHRAWSFSPQYHPPAPLSSMLQNTHQKNKSTPKHTHLQRTHCT